MEYTKIILNSQIAGMIRQEVKQGRMLVNESGALLIVKQNNNGRSVTSSAYAHGTWLEAHICNENGDIINE